MDKIQAFLNLLFNPDEEVCATSNKYACESSPVSSIKCKPELIAINPIKGWRCDEDVTAYRTFLVELDYGPLQEQHEYVKSLDMPYSVCVFSGNKSLHFGIVLKQDLPSEEIYRFIGKWILNIVDKADQVTKNPSRSIRFPGHIRNGIREQKLLEIKDRVEVEELYKWLNRYPDKKPQPRAKNNKPRNITADIANLPGWVIKILQDGVPEGKSRNQTWFGIGYEMYCAGFDEDTTIETLEPFYTEENDFRYKEWHDTVLNGLKKAELERE
jgi:hypothetical protein